MPKACSKLYNHNNAITRQLNISINPSGHSSYSYTSSQVQLDPVIPGVCCKNNSGSYVMDIDEDYLVNDHNEEIEQDIEVMPGVHVLTKPKVKQYENSVSPSLFEFLAMIHLASHRMFPWRLRLTTGMSILMSAWDWRVMGCFTVLAPGVGQSCHDTIVRTVRWGLFGARPA